LSDTSPFRSLRHRNAALYFLGLIVSNAGTWLQSTAMVWLVLRLTNSGTALGLTLAAQFLPQLIFGPWAGVIADRTNRRRMVFATQSAAAVQALVLGALDLRGMVTLPIVYLLAAVLGVISAFDNPARRSFISELVEPEDLSNAMSLNTAVMTGSRIAGPAMAGVLIALVGTGWCFMLNGISFAAVLIALVAMDASKIRPSPAAPRAKGQVREGFRYVWHNPTLKLCMLTLLVISTLSFNYQVTIPLLVKRVFGGGAGMFGALLAVTSVGSLLGSLLTAARHNATLRWMNVNIAILGVFTVLMAWSPTVAVAFVLSVPMGAGGAAVIATTSGILVAEAKPEMRGRVLALQSTVFLGSTPFGGPLVGWIAQQFGAPWGLAIGGIAALATLPFVVPATRRLQLRPAPVAVVTTPV
jgi:MFS family permease